MPPYIRLIFASALILIDESIVRLFFLVNEYFVSKSMGLRYGYEKEFVLRWPV
jgi:hypothetical protein